MTAEHPPTGAGSSTRRRRVWALPVALVLALSGCTASHTSHISHAATPAEPSYGGLPSFLPSASLQPDGELTGTAGRPAVTSQGDSVHVQLASSSVHVTVTGPQVPGQGLRDVTEATTCTWTVTLSGATGPVPVRLADFTAIDHLGTIYRPAVVAGQPTPPAQLAPGQQTSFEIRAVMATGEGLMRWAPEQVVLASWDFTVEND